MKVLIVSNMFPTTQSPSFGIFVKKCSDQLGACSALTVKNCYVLPHKSKLLAYLLFYYAVIVELISFRPRVVYCHFISHTGLPGLIAKYLFGKKLIVNCHGSDIMKPLARNNMLHRLNRRVLRSADLIVVPSNYFKRVVSEIDDSIHSNKIVVYPSAGVKLPNSADASSQPKQGAKAVLNIGFVGHLITQKGINVIAEALELINFPVVLHVAGSGEPSVFKNIVNKKITIKLYGELPQSELTAVYTQLDVLLFPTLFKESLGLTPIEAMAHYVPVIASDIGAVPEYVIPKQTGYLIPPGNPAMLTAAIENFNDLTAKQRHQLTLNARKMAEAYDETTASKILIQAIENL